jgi:hypothetical protein
MRAGDVLLIAQEVDEQGARLDKGLDELAVTFWRLGIWPCLYFLRSAAGAVSAGERA